MLQLWPNLLLEVQVSRRADHDVMVYPSVIWLIHYHLLMSKSVVYEQNWVWHVVPA